MSATAKAVRALAAARDEFLSAIRASELAHVEPLLVKFMQPAIYMETGPAVATEMPMGRSRFSGVPDLPAGTKWSLHDHGAYRFVGQLNLGEVPPPPQSSHAIDGSTGQPLLSHRDGLLSFFVAEMPDDDVFWRDPGYLTALYTPADRVRNLAAAKAPAGAPFAVYHLKACVPVTSFRVGWEAPFRKECVHLASEWPLTAEETDSYAYEELMGKLKGAEEYLLGYPSYDSLCYDPTPEPYEDYVHLMGLRSSDVLSWCWQDGARLSVFIKREDLLRGDLSALTCDAG